MYTEFHIKANALDISFINGVKAMFKSKSISIIITEEQDETEYLLQSDANRKALEHAMASKEGYRFTPEEFNKLSEDLLNGKKLNVSKLKKIKLSS